jgi:hypothetical protein
VELHRDIERFILEGGELSCAPLPQAHEPFQNS